MNSGIFDNFNEREGHLDFRGIYLDLYMRNLYISAAYSKTETNCNLSKEANIVSGL